MQFLRSHASCLHAEKLSPLLPSGIATEMKFCGHMQTMKPMFTMKGSIQTWAHMQRKDDLQVNIN